MKSTRYPLALPNVRWFDESASAGGDGRGKRADLRQINEWAAAVNVVVGGVHG